MITDLKVNEQNKKEYYEKGYWTEQTLFDVWADRVSKFPDHEYVSDNRAFASPTPKLMTKLAVLLLGSKVSE